MTRRVGLYGGSFNPIHFGHLISARSVAEQAGLQQVMLVVAGVPPHKPADGLAPAADRLEMARLAVAGDPLFVVSDVELQRTGPSYTIDTIEEVGRQLGPDVELAWIIGADSLPELATWRRVRALVERVEILTAARPGWREPDLAALRAAVGEEHVQKLLARRLTTPRIEISATELRERVRSGRSVRYCLPDRVIEYISAKGLYRGR